MKKVPRCKAVYNRSFLDFCKGSALLRLIFSVTICVRCLAVASLEEEYLKDSFSGVDLRRQWCSIANLDGNVTFPTRFQRCNVYDDTAASVSTLTNADGHQISRNAEVL